MENILIYVAIGAGALFLVLLILAIAGKGEQLRKWLGPIGGLIVVIVAVLGFRNRGGGNDDLAKIRAENERIRGELEKLKVEANDLKAKYAAEKAAYEQQLASLNQQLAAKEAERKALELQLGSTASKTPLEWFNSLPESEKQKIKQSIEGKIGEEI